MKTKNKTKKIKRKNVSKKGKYKTDQKIKNKNQKIKN